MFESVDENLVTIQMKTFEQHFPLVLFVNILYKLVIKKKSKDEILKCNSKST